MDTTDAVTTNLTITEALAETKTLKARIAKRQAELFRYFARDAKVIDPLVKQGGTAIYWAKESQAITDLMGRLVQIRIAIQRANLTTELTIRGITRSIAAWLTWRKEIAPLENAFLKSQLDALTKCRQQAEQNRGVLRDKSTATEVLPDVLQIEIAVDEVGLMERADWMTETLGQLDGKLSLLNATTFLTIPM